MRVVDIVSAQNYANKVPMTNLQTTEEILGCVRAAAVNALPPKTNY